MERYKFGRKTSIIFLPIFLCFDPNSPVFHDFIFFLPDFCDFCDKNPPSALGAKKKDQIYPTHLTKRPNFCATKISLSECVRRKAVKFFFQPTVQGGPDRGKGVTAKHIIPIISSPPPAEVRPSSPRGWFRKALARMPPPAAPPQRPQPRPLLPAPAHVPEGGDESARRSTFRFLFPPRWTPPGRGSKPHTLIKAPPGLKVALFFLGPRGWISIQALVDSFLLFLLRFLCKRGWIKTGFFGGIRGWISI